MNTTTRNRHIYFVVVIVVSVAFILFNMITVLEEIHIADDIQEIPKLKIKNTEIEKVPQKKLGLEANKYHTKLGTYSNTKYVSIELNSTFLNPVNRMQNSKNGDKDLISSTSEHGQIVNTKSTSSKKGRYAYNFVLGGIHESEPGYKGYFYTILMSVNLLKKLGSEADFWVWAQLSPNSTLDTIPEEEMRLFDALDIKVVTMEKPSYASFSSLMYDKFRALQKTEYKRFMYLDSDILPLVNMDYYFHLSDPDETSLPTILQPNMNLATKRAPCNGGMFMMHPAVGAWEQLAATVNRQREEGRMIPYPHFDYELGWGHNFTGAGDNWESLNRNGTDWHFYGSHTDQGLWYYYSKYLRKDVSILVGRKVQTWTAGNDNNAKIPVKVKEVNEDFSKYSPKPIIYQHHCDDPTNKHRCYPTLTNIAHFVSDYKPWMQGILYRWFNRKNDTDALNDAHRLWFKELDELNKNLHLGLDVYNWNDKHADLKKRPPFGLEPSWKDNTKDILSQKKFA